MLEVLVTNTFKMNSETTTQTIQNKAYMNNNTQQHAFTPYIFIFIHKSTSTIHHDRAHLFKGVPHPRPIFWLFVRFAQKIKHIDDKLDMFLEGTILRNLTTALEFH